MTTKLQAKIMRRRRIRAKVSGTAERPRMAVFISLRHIGVQLIDDTKGVTLASVSTVGQKDIGNTMTEKATWAGDQIAANAKKAKIKQVTFDRGGKLYHGRLAALATAARGQGLEF